MSRNDDGSMVDKVNEKIRDARESLSRKFEDEDEQSTLPLLEKADGQRDQSWWEENVQQHEAAADLLPERNDSGN